MDQWIESNHISSVRLSSDFFSQNYILYLLLCGCHVVSYDVPIYVHAGFSTKNISSVIGHWWTGGSLFELRLEALVPDNQWKKRLLKVAEQERSTQAWTGRAYIHN